MKYSICGFDQRSLCAINKKSDKKIDCTDLVIIQWVAEFIARDATRKMTIDGKTYAWVSQTTLAEDFPFMDFSKRTFSDRLDKLSEIGIINKRVEKQIGYGTFTFIRLTSMYDDLLYSKDAGDAVQTASGCGSNNIGDAVQTTPKDLYTNKPIYETKKEKGTTVPKKKDEFLCGLLEIGISEQCAIDWMDIRAKAKKASNSQTALKQLKTTLVKIQQQFGITPDDAIKICVINGWYGCKESYFVNIKLSDYNISPIVQTSLFGNVNHSQYEIDQNGNKINKKIWQ